MAPTLATGATTIRKLRNIGNPKPDDDGARLAHFRSAAVTEEEGTMKEGNACRSVCAREEGRHGGYPMQPRRARRAARCVTMTTLVLYTNGGAVAWRIKGAPRQFPHVNAT